MGSIWALFVVLHIASLAFAVIALKRLYTYIRTYRFSESKYTLLFSFIHLHWIGIFYIAFIFFWIPLSFVILTRL